MVSIHERPRLAHVTSAAWAFAVLTMLAGSMSIVRADARPLVRITMLPDTPVAYCGVEFAAAFHLNLGEPGVIENIRIGALAVPSICISKVGITRGKTLPSEQDGRLMQPSFARHDPGHGTKDQVPYVQQ